MSADALQRAHDFMQSNAREVERVVFNHVFRDRFDYADQTVAATDALAAFQNADGGYGRGLEPDLQTQRSTVLATDVAMEYWHLLEPNAALVQDALDFLIGAFDTDRQYWPFLVDGANDAPHAPWWELSQRDLDHDAGSVNPRFEVLARLLDHRDALGAFPIERVLADSIELIEVQTMPMHRDDLRCVALLAESPHLNDAQRERLTRFAAAAIPASVEKDPDQWGTYCLQPLDVITHGNSPFRADLADLVDQSVDYQLGQQLPDGGWTPTWSWFGNFPDAWPAAETDWRGVVTLQMAIKLNSFGAFD